MACSTMANSKQRTKLMGFAEQMEKVVTIVSPPTRETHGSLDGGSRDSIGDVASQQRGSKNTNGTSNSHLHYKIASSPALTGYSENHGTQAIKEGDSGVGVKKTPSMEAEKEEAEEKEQGEHASKPGYTEPVKSHWAQVFAPHLTSPIPAIDNKAIINYCDYHHKTPSHSVVSVTSNKINERSCSTQVYDHNTTATLSSFAVPVKKGGNQDGNAVVDINKTSARSEKLEILRLESGHPLPTSTFFQATLNCVSMLFGLGILSSPYAVAKAGWMGAIISLMVAMSYAYAAHLMARCVQYHPDCGTYQDMARFALGKRTRKLITALFYIEITGTLVGYCISVGDNLAYFFPNAGFGLPGLSNRNFMIFVASLIILPSVWLRDLSALSFTSIWCIASTMLLLISVILTATINHVGFTHSIPFLRIQGLPVAAGLYAFSYGGTSVFPSIYKSMKDPSKFTQVLVISFSIATASMVGLGIIGATMFGELTRSQVTLSMPVHFISTKIVLWMTILTPICKFALQLSPITTAAEAQLYRHCKCPRTILFAVGTLMRSCILAFIAILSMVFPYFECIIALVGSSMTISICMIFPCLFYLKLYWNQIKALKKSLITIMVILGIIIGACGTFVAIEGLINRRRSHP